jgi:hypothetical protein
MNDLRRSPRCRYSTPVGSTIDQVSNFFLPCYDFKINASSESVRSRSGTVDVPMFQTLQVSTLLAWSGSAATFMLPVTLIHQSPSPKANVAAAILLLYSYIINKYSKCSTSFNDLPPYTLWAAAMLFSLKRSPTSPHFTLLVTINWQGNLETSSRPSFCYVIPSIFCSWEQPWIKNYTITSPLLSII